MSHLGYYAATWQLPNDLGVRKGSVGYNVPGRFASVGADHRDPAQAGAFVVFAAPELSYDRHDPEQQKRLIDNAFAGLGWQVPSLLTSLRQAPDLYFELDQPRNRRYLSQGEYASSVMPPAGPPSAAWTGTAVVAAYVLAGELARAQGDYRAAFTRYEGRLRKYAQTCQAGGDRTGRFLAPAPPPAYAPNTLLSRPLFLNGMLKLGEKISSTVDLPDYPVDNAAVR